MIGAWTRLEARGNLRRCAFDLQSLREEGFAARVRRAGRGRLTSAQGEGIGPLRITVDEQVELVLAWLQAVEIEPVRYRPPLSNVGPRNPVDLAIHPCHDLAISGLQRAPTWCASKS
jgi:hypothetical protein